MSTGLNLVADIGSGYETAMACQLIYIQSLIDDIQYKRARAQWRVQL